MTTATKPALPPLPKSEPITEYDGRGNSLTVEGAFIPAQMESYGADCEEHGYQRGLEAARAEFAKYAEELDEVARDCWNGSRMNSQARICERIANSLRAAHHTEQTAPADPMDWPLPCDVKVGCGTHGKGTALRGLVARMQRLYDEMRKKDDKAPADPLQELVDQAQALDMGYGRPMQRAKPDALAQSDKTGAKCWCHTCRPITLDDCRMVLCPTCGNKRCPRANDHHNACTGSNEPGQPGSAYPAPAAPGEQA